MTVYLIRHGETDYNVEGRYQGMYGESRLTQRGREQARDLPPLLSTLPFTHVFCSTAHRARETLSLALSDYPAACVTYLDTLREVDTGILTDHLVSDMHKTHPDFYAAQPNGVTDYTAVGGEGPEDVLERARRVLAEVENSGHDTVAIVSHGAFLAYLVSAATGLPLLHRRAPLDNCSVSVLEIKEGKGRLRLWNYTAGGLTRFAPQTAAP